MAFHHSLRDLLTRVGPSLLDDADELRSALDDYLSETEATPAEIELVTKSVRHGALARLVSLLDNHADPGAAVRDTARILAEQSGADERGARWAVAALGYAVGRVEEQVVRSTYEAYRTPRPDEPEGTPVNLTPAPPPPPAPSPVTPRTPPAAVTQPTPRTARQPEPPITDGSSTPVESGRRRRGALVVSLLVILAAVGGGVFAWTALSDRDADASPTDRTGEDSTTPTPTDGTTEPSNPSTAGGSDDSAAAYIAIASRSGSTSRVQVLDVATGKSRALSTGGDATEPSVSADGQTVAFILATEDGKRLAISRGTGAPQLLDVGREPSDPAISPDGSSVAYVTQTTGGKDVSIRDLAATSADVIAGGSSDEFDPAWSADGTRLAYVLAGSSNDSLVVIDAESGNEVARTVVSGRARSPALSPSGSRIAFIGSIQGNAEVVVTGLGASSEATNLSQSAETETAVAWLANGRLATAAPTRGIVTISEESSIPEQLTAGLGDSF